ncbi:MAG: hypothetical protein IKD77_04680 [Bacilli bacterium]|nr:hypothetical protein [Bacilli bacterium]
MEGFEKFIEKKVAITVAFSGFYRDGGSVPKKYIGVLKKFEGNYLELSDVKVEHIGIHGSSFTDYSNYAILNKQYIIIIAEA